MANFATPTNYELILSKFPSEVTLDPTKIVTLSIFGTVIPGMANRVIEAFYLGAGLNFDGPLTFDDWSVNYIVDENFENWKILNKWLKFMYDKKEKLGELPSVYLIDCVLRALNNFKQEVLLIKFKNLWIKSLGAVRLSEGEGETQLEGEATFSFDRYDVEEI